MPHRSHLSFNLGVARGISSMFAEWPLPERLSRARELGFRGVEGQPPARPAELRGHLDALGMTFACMSFARGASDRRELGLTGLRDRTADFRVELAQAIDIAGALGCSRLHPLAGLIADASERARAEAVYLENLSYACRQAAATGMQILIEPICAHRQPNYLLQTCAQALYCMNQVCEPNLRLVLDMYHAAGAGESAIHIAESHAALIGVLQVAQWPRRIEPSADDPVLRGTLAALDAADWDGWICAEYEPAGPTSSSLSWTRALH